MSSSCRILYCHCAYARVVPPAVKAEVLERLTNANVSFEAVPDLCEMSARRDPRLRELASAAATSEVGAAGIDGGEGPLAIAACYPRAVKWLFSAADTPLPEHGVRILNMRTDTAEAIASALLDPSARDPGAPAAEPGPEAVAAAAATTTGPGDPS